jgi:hypothetical protein
MPLPGEYYCLYGFKDRRECHFYAISHYTSRVTKIYVQNMVVCIINDVEKQEVFFIAKTSLKLHGIGAQEYC